MDDKNKSKSEIIKRKKQNFIVEGSGGSGLNNTNDKGFDDDPFGENNGFNFKKSKSVKKVTNNNNNMNNLEGDIFDNSPDKSNELEAFEKPNKDNILSGKRESKNKPDDDFDFDDNFADFGNNKKEEKKENMDFKFDDPNFDDPFGQDNFKPKKQNYDFDFNENKTEEQIIVNEEVFDEPVNTVKPRQSSNLDFDDPFGNFEKNSETKNQFTDQQSGMTEEMLDNSEIDAFEDPFTQNSSTNKMK